MNKPNLKVQTASKPPSIFRRITAETRRLARLKFLHNRAHFAFCAELSGSGTSLKKIERQATKMLFKAIKDEDLSGAYVAVKAGADIHAKDWLGRTAEELASRIWIEPIVSIFIRMPVPITKPAI